MWNIEDKQGFETDSMSGKGQINPDSDFGKVIFDLAKNSENLIFVDIGTWNGLGSTKCFIEAMVFNKSSKLYTIENNTEKIDFAKQSWKSFIKENGLYVEFINGTLVSNTSIDNWLSDNNVELSKTEQYWLEIDKTNSTNLIILDVNNIDILLIDGSEYSGFLELMLLKDISKYILLDDVNSLKNKMSRDYLLQSEDFLLVEENLLSRGGYSVFRKK